MTTASTPAFPYVRGNFSTTKILAPAVPQLIQVICCGIILV